MTKLFKTFAIAATTMALTAGTALAGPGKDCADKKHSTATEASMSTSSETAVMGATAEAKMRKNYTFDEALEICEKKAATDLQACIDYKTGKTKAKAKPDS